jgi:hypothetical protein
MDAHAREAAAAARWMADPDAGGLDSRPIGEGLAVVGTTAGRSWAGVVEWIDGTRVVVRHAAGWWEAFPVQDARPAVRR